MTIPEDIEQLQAKLAATDDDSEEAGILQDLLSNFGSIGLDDQQLYTERLSQLAHRTDDPLHKANALHHQAVFIRIKGDYDASIDLFMQAISCFKQINDIKGQAQSFNSLGNAHYLKGHYADALDCYFDSLRLYGQTDDKWGIATAHNNIGNIYEKQGNYPEALKNQFASLKVSQDNNYKRGIANAHNNIGLLYFYYGSYQEALDNYQASISLLKEVGDKSAIAICYNNLGLIYQVRGEYEEALTNHLASLQLNEEINNQWGIAASYNNMGNIYEKQGLYEEALKSQFASIKLSEGVGDKYIPASAHSNIGAIYEKQGDHTNALEHLLIAMALSEEIGYKEVIKESSLSLSMIYRATGDYGKALDYYEKFHKQEKELTGQESQKQLTSLNFQHDMELKEKEAALLKQKNEEIGVYARKLEISNNDLKQFANVASHDLREPLRMVNQYMNLLGQSLGERINPVEKQFLAFASDGATRMESLIHDLLRLAKVDANPQIVPVPLDDILRDVMSNIGMLVKERGAQITSGPLPILMADRTQLIQLFQNIIGNGIKYNESNPPAIDIRCLDMGSDILLTIADNGIGIPNDYREKAFQLFQRVPTEKNYGGTGIGLAICKKICENMGGHIEIDDNPEGGTIFKISLPQACVAKE